MIHFIFGRAGSGKTSRTLAMAAESLTKGKRVFLLVPEQMAVEAEQRMADLLGERSQLALEILNFRRLTNRIFREYGGLSYQYISRAGRSLLMWRTLTELAPMLCRKAEVDRARVSKTLAAHSECKAYRISPAALERAMKTPEVGDGTELHDKLSDLSLIFASYNRLAAEIGADAADDLEKAAELLQKHNFFEGAHVFLDSFNGYTPAEYAIIRAIMRQAESVTISLCLDPNDSSAVPFENQRQTANTLFQMAKSVSGQVTCERLRENFRAASDALRYLERSLWSLNLGEADAFAEDTTALRLIACGSLFAECEAAAADICKKLREGARRRDIAVITRGMDRYDGILDVIFEKYGIPCFLSKRTDIKSKPLIRLIFAAFSLRATNFRTEDVITYMKTGLCGISPDDILLLENYAECWSLRGFARWNADFEMNPDGFKEIFTEDAAKRLDKINTIREKLMLPLADFHDTIEHAENVRDYATALYNFLMKLEIPAKLQEQADALRASDPTAASELGQLWKILIGALDELVAVLSDFPCDGLIFTELLSILFDETDIGRIPASIDEVTAGDASLLRAAKKHVYILGANEGIFPGAPSSDGILTDAERETLLSVGIELAGNAESQAADERFAFYRALTCASESVTVIWSGSDLSGHEMKPSLGVARLQALFPKVKTEIYSLLSTEDRMEGRGNLLEFTAEAGNTPLGAALREYAQLTAADRLAKLSIPLCDDDVQLNPDTCERISGGDLALTQGRLDSYVLCHFSYYCKYILGLASPEKAKFDAGNIGIFVHHILELFVARASISEAMSEAEIDHLVDDLIADYMTTVAKIAPDYKGSRLAHLFARLRRSSLILCKNLAAEFSQSEFAPACCELPIRFPKPDEQTVEPLSVPLGDGTSAYIYGIADRVDTMEKDGKRYVRVVDYKTGAKEFSMDDVAMGLNLQMLLYLFSIWKNGNKSGSALAVPQDTVIVPAGVLYFGAKIKPLTLEAEISPEEVKEKISDGLSRRGLLLDDRDVLAAMERDLSGKYLPVKTKKDGDFYKTDALCSLESFGKLLNSIENTIQKIGCEIKAGHASAHPMKNKKHNACQYCELKPVCRKSHVSKKGGEGNYE